MIIIKYINLIENKTLSNNKKAKEWEMPIRKYNQCDVFIIYKLLCMYLNEENNLKVLLY